MNPMNRRTFLTALGGGAGGILAAAVGHRASASPAKGGESRMVSEQPFRLEALCDFVDDAGRITITQRHVDAMMATLREMGVTRVSWAYYADGRGGFLVPAGLEGGWANIAATYETLGNPLQVAVEAAHRHEMELYAYYKPYETGPGVLLPDGSPQGRQFGRIRHKGGWLTWMDPFLTDHPALRIRHRPGPAISDLSNVRVCALKLVKRDDTPTRVTKEHIQIWTSRLNRRYRPLEIDFNVSEAVEPSPKEVRDLRGTLLTAKGAPVRTLTLSGFRLRDPYILVTTDFTDEAGDFENAGTDLLSALDAEGNEIPGVFATGAGVWQAKQIDFRDWGLLFDTGLGRHVVRLDAPNASGRRGLIAFTRGRNEYLPGALCEAEPQVYRFWLACLREMLEAGVDGVDFRVENHGTHTDYFGEYGYNDTVLQECARRGRTDVQTVAQVRGKAYTRFLRAAKRLIASHGKRMRINLNIDWFRPDPPPARRIAYPANINFDWRAWVDGGLLDEAILRMFALPLTAIFDDPVAGEMISRCRANGIPLTVNRYVNPNYVDEFKQVRADGRFCGFILYETASYLKLDESGGCSLHNDVVKAVSRELQAGNKQ